MKKLLMFMILSLLVINVSIAEPVSPSFAFTADDKVADWKENELIIDKSSEIVDDEFWNESLTKLDYILMQLKQHAESVSARITDEEMSWYFERLENWEPVQEYLGKYESITVNNNVYFDKDTGKILVGFEIDKLGKAKKPMAELCKKILNLHIMQYPLPSQRMYGYSYHNSILNEIFRGDSYENYTIHLEKIAKNLIYSLKLNSTINIGNDHDADLFTMYCIKKDSSDNYEFRKFSQSYRRD